MASSDFTIADVLAWARTKPADKEYSYWCSQCALGQFLVATARATDPVMGDLWWADETTRRGSIAPEINAAAEAYPHTFGAFARRLAALLPAEPQSDTWTKADAYLTDIERVSA